MNALAVLQLLFFFFLTIYFVMTVFFIREVRNKVEVIDLKIDRVIEQVENQKR